MKPFLRLKDDPSSASMDAWRGIVAEAEDIFSAAVGDALEQAAEDLREAAREVGASDAVINSIDTDYTDGPSLLFGDEESYDEAEALELGTEESTPSALVRGLFAQRGALYGQTFSEGLVRRLEEA